MDSKYPQRNANSLEKNHDTWETQYSLKIGECVKSSRSRLGAIQRLKPPMTIKVCRTFGGMVNFLSIFCPELQKFLKPIYDLTKKGKQFVWEKEQQMEFKEINSRLQNMISWVFLKFLILYLFDGENFPQSLC